MYKTWFLEYASYVILERAVPHLADGLKPVQRRILHSMKRMDDGRFNKVANIIGHTMQFHPHGDAAIGDALVQLGQKELLIDMQGNWGNIYTGDNAAAPRYIEARPSKFALAVVFNHKTTEWKQSYDGRNDEPVTLPVKFPLLLAQGVEGIAVGLASKILPHNFIELIDASIKHLKGEDFELYPDFPTGGYIDAANYNDGLRGGKVRVRAKISKGEKRTLIIEDLPFGKTTNTLIESITSANEKGKIKIVNVVDNTAADVQIVIKLPADVSPDNMIDALYAVTDCEISLSPNSTIIHDNKPVFLGVKEMLRISAKNTLNLLKLELEIRKRELDEAWHLSSLEKIFIENRIYILIEECETWDSIIETIDTALEPFKSIFKNEVTKDDIAKLTEIKIKRISKYDAFKADKHIKNIEEEIVEILKKLANIVNYTIDYYLRIKEKYGKGKERKTEIRSFEEISAQRVVIRNLKLYVNIEDGFAGTTLKQNSYVADCSDIDDIIVIRKDGTYFITKVDEKIYIGKDVIHIDVWKKDDERTTYNLIYRDGKTGYYYIKRFFVKGITRDKEYNTTRGSDNSKIVYFSANPNGEAEIIKVIHRPRKRLKKKILEFDFSDTAIKGRQAMGNLVTKYAVQKIVLKEEGISTLGGLKVWFDTAVKRINSAERGEYLGNFKGGDKILTIYKSGEYQITNFDLANHFDDDLLKIEKFNAEKIWNVIFYDAEKGFHYLKRFEIEESDNKNSFIGDHPDSILKNINSFKNANFEIVFGGKNKSRDNEIVNAEDFIGVKGYKARGKRLSNYEIEEIIEIEPEIEDEIIEDNNNENNEDNIENKENIIEENSKNEENTEDTSFNEDPDFEVTQTDDDGNQTTLNL